MSTWAIGDVQGCAAELERLLERIAFDPRRDRLWFVGDLVNRGPASLEVLRRVRALGEAAIVVLGNHDLHLLALATGAGRARGRLRDADASLAAILAAPDRGTLLDWLQARPLLHHDPVLQVTMIHAGLPPQWDLATARDCARELETALRGERSAELFAHMYGDGPDLWDPALAGYDRLRFTTNCLTRLRVVDREGRLRLKFKGEIEKLPAGLLPWFRAPGRRTRGERLVCGHWSALGYRDEEQVLALDTGCVWGGALTAQRIDGAATRVSVPSIDGGLPIGLD
jgi:bis(5'-nucleosyl)-tetraphosphatase (symmetrical)